MSSNDASKLRSKDPVIETIWRNNALNFYSTHLYYIDVDLF